MISLSLHHYISLLYLVFPCSVFGRKGICPTEDLEYPRPITRDIYLTNFEQIPTEVFLLTLLSEELQTQLTEVRIVDEAVPRDLVWDVQQLLV